MISTNIFRILYLMYFYPIYRPMATKSRTSFRAPFQVSRIRASRTRPIIVYRNDDGADFKISKREESRLSDQELSQHLQTVFSAEFSVGVAISYYLAESVI